MNCVVLFAVVEASIVFKCRIIVVKHGVSFTNKCTVVFVVTVAVVVCVILLCADVAVL